MLPQQIPPDLMRLFQTNLLAVILKIAQFHTLGNMKFDGSPGSPQLHVLQLPSEVTSLILRHLDPRSLINASHVCHYWSDICAKDPVLRRRIRKREKMHRRFRWCRAKYGDGVIKNNKLYKGSTAVSFKQNARTAQLNFLKALTDLRNMWQELYDRLLALT